MTPTEKAYSKYVGKLFYSKNRNSLVMVYAMQKPTYSNRWQYDVEYLDPKVSGYVGKTIKCSRIEMLLNTGQWIPADQYITNQPPVSSAK